jgi:hypothetical protein
MSNLDAVKKVMMYQKDKSGFVKEPTIKEMADLVVLVLSQVKVIEEAIKAGRLDGKTPIKDVDYISKDSALKMLTQAVNYALNNEEDKFINRVEGKFNSKVYLSEKNRDETVIEAIERINQKLHEVKDGVVTEEEVQRAAQLALGMIELPDFSNLIKDNLDGEAVREVLSRLTGDKRYTVQIADVNGLAQALSQVSQVRSNSSGTIGKQQVYGFIRQAIIDGIITSGGTTTFLGLTDTPATYASQAGKLLAVKTGEDGVEFIAPPSGSGDVVGPASATDNAIARYDSTTGKLIQNSVATINDNGDLKWNGFITNRSNLTVPVATPVAVYLNDTHGTTLNTTYQYLIRAVTTATNSDTGTSAIVYYNEPTTTWSVREVSVRTTDSNAPRFQINGSTVECYHNSTIQTYAMNIAVESRYVQETDATIHTFGADSMWQRVNDDLSYIDGSISVTANKAPAVFKSTADVSSSRLLNLKGDRATPATNDEIYQSFYLNDDAGNEGEVARLTVQSTDITSASEDGIIKFSLVSNGTLTEKLNIESAYIRPTTNNGLALGAATASFSDLFLAEGGVINWDNGDVTITQTGNNLTIVGNVSAITDDTSSSLSIENTNLGESMTALDVHFNSATPNDYDYIQNLYYFDNNSATKKLFARMRVYSDDITATSEGSSFVFETLLNGVLAPRLIIGSEGTATINGIVVGSDTLPGIVSSNENQDLVLQAGNGYTGHITLTDGTNGNISLTPHGTGAVAISTTLELGHASDTTLSRVSAGVVAVEGVALASTLITENAQTGTSYTLVLADASKFVSMNNASANTLTVPPNSSVAFPTGTRLMVQQRGAGSTTIAAGSGVTINAPASAPLAIAEQYGSRGLLKTATDTWQII